MQKQKIADTSFKKEESNFKAVKPLVWQQSGHAVCNQMLYTNALKLLQHNNFQVAFSILFQSLLRRVDYYNLFRREDER